MAESPKPRSARAVRVPVGRARPGAWRRWPACRGPSGARGRMRWPARAQRSAMRRICCPRAPARGVPLIMKLFDLITPVWCRAFTQKLQVGGWKRCGEHREGDPAGPSTRSRAGARCRINRRPGGVVAPLAARPRARLYATPCRPFSPLGRPRATGEPLAGRQGLSGAVRQVSAVRSRQACPTYALREPSSCRTCPRSSSAPPR